MRVSDRLAQFAERYRLSIWLEERLSSVMMPIRAPHRKRERRLPRGQGREACDRTSGSSSCKRAVAQGPVVAGMEVYEDLSGYVGSIYRNPTR